LKRTALTWVWKTLGICKFLGLNLKLEFTQQDPFFDNFYCVVRIARNYTVSIKFEFVCVFNREHISGRFSFHFFTSNVLTISATLFLHNRVFCRLNLTKWNRAFFHFGLSLHNTCLHRATLRVSFMFNGTVAQGKKFLSSSQDSRRIF